MIKILEEQTKSSITHGYSNLDGSMELAKQDEFFTKPISVKRGEDQFCKVI